MKKIYLLTMILALAVVFNACQKDELLSAEEYAKKANTESFAAGASLENVPDCEECLDEPYIASVDVYGGGNPGSVIGQIELWNDNENLYIRIGDFSYDKIIIVPFLDGGSEEPGNPVYNQHEVVFVDGVKTYVLAEGWDFCTAKRFWIKIEGKAGGTTSYFIDYYRYQICEEACELDFYGAGYEGQFVVEEVSYNRKAVYTFIPEEAGAYKIQGGLTNFTGADALVLTEEGLVVDQWTPGQSSNRIICITGQMEACEAVEITLYWYSTNQDTEITGDWTVEHDGEEIIALDSLEI